MKKILAIVLSIGVVAITQAQIEVGLKAGVNLANQTSDIDGYDTDGATGLYLGVPVRINVTENLVIQPEIAFMQKGASQNFELDVFGFKTETDAKSILNYIEIPIMAQYILGDGDIRPYVQAGPSIGIGMGTKTTGESTTTYEDPFTGQTVTETTDLDDSGSFEDAGLSAIDFGVGVGAGAIMEVGPGNLSLNILYNLGLANILDPDTSPDNSLNNRGLGVNVGFAIPIN